MHQSTSTTTTTPLRIGVLGAARIAPKAVIFPTHSIRDAQTVAVAARDLEKAQAFAQRFHIPRVHATYEALIDDPDIDAIYNPLPNSHHAAWSIRALEAGKHVLCEKPFAANAAEAVAMAETATRTGKVLMEAFHYRYHPLMVRAMAVLASGEIGPIRHIESTMCIPNYRYWDIRWRYDLAGGALMDVGCYTIHLLRTVAGAEPTVTDAQVKLRAPEVDRAVKASFTFPNAITGQLHCSMWSSTLLKLEAKIIGERGTMTILNPFIPQLFHRLTVRTAAGVRHEKFTMTPTYNFQLEAFIGAVRHGQPFPTDPADAIANMRVIDAVYQAAGLKVRAT